MAVAAVVGLTGLLAGAPSSAVTDPVDPPTPPIVETVTIDTKDADGTTTVVPLAQDRNYLLEVTGTYGWGGGIADGECSTATADPVYRRARNTLYGEGAYDVMVDLTVVEWVPVDPDAEGCDGSATHRYQYVHHTSTNGPLRLQVADTNFKDNSGTLTVTVYSLGEPPPETELVGTVTVNSASATGTATPSLAAGSTYVLRASGTYISDRKEPRIHDAECTRFAGAPGVRDVTTTDLTNDAFDLYVAGQPVQWEAVDPSPVGCDDTTHTYDYRYEPTASGPVNLRVYEPFVRDNIGSLTVSVYRITSLTADPGSPPEAVFDQVTVPGNKATPTTTNVPLRAGTTYTLEASGTYFWSYGYADAECSNTLQDPAYLRDRFALSHPTTDLFDLLVNGGTLEWEAQSPNVDGCSDDHVYRATFTPAADGVLSLKVNDTWTPDNWGGITVKVFLVPIPEPVASTLS